MISAVKKKLNNKGFTLSETMMSLLILGLVIVITGGGIVVVKNSYQRITMKSHAQTLMSTSITKVSEDLRFAEDIDTDSADAAGSVESPQFTNSETGYRTRFTNDIDKGIMRTYIYGTNSRSERLLTDKTMTDGLIPSISYSYDTNAGVFKVTVTVSRNDKTISEQEVSIRPLNE